MTARAVRRWGMALGATLAFAGGAARPEAIQSVDLELVIATDVSPSIDAAEARLQREGIAEAFLDSKVVDAVRFGALGRIAVAAIDFSSREFNRVVVDWMLVQDRQSAAAFAERLRRAPVRMGRHTSISDGLELALRMIETNMFLGIRKAIDVSGDGRNNWGRPVNLARNEAVDRGIVINGLPILGTAAGLDAYFADCVIGGPGSFVMPAHGFADFARALRQKLIREIAHARPQERPDLLVRVQMPASPRGGYTKPLNDEGCENVFGGFPPFSGFDFPLPVPR